MKTTPFTIKLSLLLIMIGLNITAWAQPNIYLCNTGTATLKARPDDPDLSVTYAASDVITWKHNGVVVKSGSGVNADRFDVPNNLAVGEHIYTAQVSSTVPCESDVSTDFKVYKLPSFQVVLANPNVPNYCTYNSASGSELVATVNLASGTTIPPDITMDYTWTVSKTDMGGTSTPTLSDIGSALSSNGSLTNTFSMTASDVATYNFEVKARFKSTAGVAIKSGAIPDVACEFTAVNKPNVIVSPKPIKPSISIVN